MHPLTHSAFHPEILGTWLILLAFGAYHGINPGMGWLFALSLGLQQRSQRAVLLSLLPIAAGHAVSILMVAALILIAGQLISMDLLRLVTASVLLSFGIFKMLTYYRHPRWVGMRVGWRDLFVWSFLMAMAHGAGLMVAPALLGILKAAPGHASPGSGSQIGLLIGVSLHTMSMLAVMAAVAAIVYRKLGLSILRRGWVNFDLIWAAALLVVGATALVRTVY